MYHQTLSPDVDVRPSTGGNPSGPFFTVVFVDDHGVLRAQQSGVDNSPLVISDSSLASDYVHFFRPGEPGETPILALKNSSDWSTKKEFLGSVIDSQTLPISIAAKILNS